MFEAASFVRRHFLAWLGITLLLWPVPLGPAPHPFDLHRVAFCIGPALYRFGEGLVPGRDLFSQYGSGQGFIFGFLLAETAQETVDRFYILHLVVALAFFILGYQFLAGLLASRGWAFAVCVLSILCQFQGEDRFSVLPSVSAYRVPFLIPVAWLFTWACGNVGKLTPSLALGVSLGLCAFWQTDTGLACLVACLGTAFLLLRPILDASRMAAVVAISACAAFFGMSMVAYGAGAVSVGYIWGLFAPWLWYTGGGELSLHRYPWTSDRAYLATVIALICAMSVLAIFSKSIFAPPHRVRFRASGLAFLACISLLLHAKYVVRPHISYWAGAALPAFAVMAWLGRDLLPHLYRRLLADVGLKSLEARRAWRIPQRLAALTCLLAAVWLVAGSTGYPRYDSVFNLAIRAGSNSSTAQGGSVAFRTVADLALIRENTRPGERTAIISYYDWAYLLETKRPPRYFILPVPMTLTSQFGDLARTTREATVLFIDKRCDFLDVVDRDWREAFRQEGESDNLVLYVRRQTDS